MRYPSPRRTTLLAAVWLLVVSGPAPAADTVALGPATQAASGLPRLHSLLVSQRGELVVERYLHGGRPASLANLKSASKSVLSALVGIAIERGLLPGVQAPIAPFFPTLLDPQKRQITIEDLLTMRSGWGGQRQPERNRKKPGFNCPRRGGLVYTSNRPGTQNGNPG